MNSRNYRTFIIIESILLISEIICNIVTKLLSVQRNLDYYTSSIISFWRFNYHEIIFNYYRFSMICCKSCSNITRFWLIKSTSTYLYCCIPIYSSHNWGNTTDYRGFIIVKFLNRTTLIIIIY